MFVRLLLTSSVFVSRMLWTWGITLAQILLLNEMKGNKKVYLIDSYGKVPKVPKTLLELRTSFSTKSMISIICRIIKCRIWSWSPMLCEKHGPRDSVDKNQGRRPRFLSLLRPKGHVFHTAWETMMKSYYSTLTDLFFLRFIHMNMNFSPLNWAIFGSLHGC